MNGEKEREKEKPHQGFKRARWQTIKSYGSLADLYLTLILLIY